MALVVENMPAKAEDARDAGSFPGRERFPGEGHGNPFQCSRLENPMYGGAWQATVHGVAESDTPGATWHARMHQILGPRFCLNIMIVIE